MYLLYFQRSLALVLYDLIFIVSHQGYEYHIASLVACRGKVLCSPRSCEDKTSRRRATCSASGATGTCHLAPGSVRLHGLMLNLTRDCGWL